MKIIFLQLILIFGIGFLPMGGSAKDNEKSPEARLENIDAVEAMAIANQWKWTRKEIKSYVTPFEVVFKFPNGRIKTIPLPKDKMVVAIAPYVQNTHT